MVYQTTIEQLQNMLRIITHEGQEHELIFNQKGWEYYLVDKQLRGISYVEDNQRKALYITWPLKVEVLIHYANFFLDFPQSNNMCVIPSTSVIGSDFTGTIFE